MHNNNRWCADNSQIACGHLNILFVSRLMVLVRLVQIFLQYYCCHWNKVSACKVHTTNTRAIEQYSGRCVLIRLANHTLSHPITGMTYRIPFARRILWVLLHFPPTTAWKQKNIISFSHERLKFRSRRTPDQSELIGKFVESTFNYRTISGRLKLKPMTIKSISLPVVQIFTFYCANRLGEIICVLKHIRKPCKVHWKSIAHNMITHSASLSFVHISKHCMRSAECGRKSTRIFFRVCSSGPSSSRAWRMQYVCFCWPIEFVFSMLRCKKTCNNTLTETADSTHGGAVDRCSPEIEVISNGYAPNRNEQLLDAAIGIGVALLCNFRESIEDADNNNLMSRMLPRLSFTLSPVQVFCWLNLCIHPFTWCHFQDDMKGKTSILWCICNAFPCLL